MLQQSETDICGDVQIQGDERKETADDTSNRNRNRNSHRISQKQLETTDMAGEPSPLCSPEGGRLANIKATVDFTAYIEQFQTMLQDKTGKINFFVLFCFVFVWGV